MRLWGSGEERLCRRLYCFAFFEYFVVVLREREGEECSLLKVGAVLQFEVGVVCSVIRTQLSGFYWFCLLFYELAESLASLYLSMLSKEPGMADPVKTGWVVSLWSLDELIWLTVALRSAGSTHSLQRFLEQLWMGTGCWDCGVSNWFRWWGSPNPSSLNPQYPTASIPIPASSMPFPPNKPP